ncbi:palmitoyltransferase for Vac8p [Paramarasmius palmivorus]|uniref:Palmitoyltransferase for Vac8p n=1 Tax=Paramarasmius palmivorus TaxID=297713 RepID=A0AAW0BPV0_9AGAR
MRPLPKPLLSFTNLPSSPPKDLSANLDDERKPRKWYHYLPLCGTIILILAPHPSLLYFLVNHHLKTLDDPIRFSIHLIVTYTLTFLTFTSLIICVARDPGPVSVSENAQDDNDEMGLTDALLAGGADDEDFNSPTKWCRKCWAPKPERTHHYHCLGPAEFNIVFQTTTALGWVPDVSDIEHIRPSFTFFVA